MHAALPQTAKTMFNKLQLVNLESVRARVGATTQDMTDYRRFLALKAAAEKLDPVAFAHCHFSPTPEMDQVWHAHILDTRLYQEACAAMEAKGAFVHHDPHGGDDLDVQQARREFTKQAFMKCYGGLPVSKWPPTTMEIIEGAGRGYDDDENPDDDEEEAADAAVGDQTHATGNLFGGDLDDPEPAAKRSRVDNGFSVFIKTMKGRTLTLHANKDTTVKAIKALLHAAGEGPPDQLRIVFAGKELQDDLTMGHYNVKAPATLHMLMRLRGC